MCSSITVSYLYRGGGEKVGGDNEPEILSWQSVIKTWFYCKEKLTYMNTCCISHHKYFIYMFCHVLKSETHKVIIYLHFIVAKLQFREVECG